MENADIEKIYNDTFAGCALFYRDTFLDEELISKYEKNQILHERGYTDMSFKGGGLKTNLRFLIASSKGKNLSTINPKSNETGHILLKSDSFFKVLDIYKVGDKTQILLLNISQESIGLFEKMTSNIENQIIVKARESLNNKLDEPVVEALNKPEWRERTKHPIGMSDDGVFFKIDVNTI